MFKISPLKFFSLGLDEVLIAAAAALFKLAWIGIPIGAGNQALQIVFVEHLRNPAMFQGDALLETLPFFTTWFFHVFAWLLPANAPLAPVLVVAHFLTTWLTFMGFVALMRGFWPEEKRPLTILIPLVAGSLSGLGESPLTPLAFSHTSFAFALSLIVLNFLLRRRVIPAIALIGLMANIHLLTAAYTACLAGMWGLFHLRELPWKRVFLGALAGILFALPVVPLLMRSSGEFDAVWLNLLEVRSAHHAFPSTWWASGDQTIPRFLLWMGAGALAWSVAGGRHKALAAWILAPILLMTLGTVGSELVPIPILLRAQLFRSSIFLMVLALCLTARMVNRLFSPPPEVSAHIRWLGPPVALASAAILWLPAFVSLIAPFLLLAAWTARGFRKLTGGAALVVGLALIVSTLADLQLHTAFWTPGTGRFPHEAILVGIAALFIAALFPLRRWRWAHLPALPLAVFLAAWCYHTFPRNAPQSDAWSEIQTLAREQTPPDAIFLTPPRQSGFRIGSQRAIIGEWRDGTQQFFDPDFAVKWDLRMQALSPDRTRQFRAEDWIRLAEAHGADFLVLPRDHHLPLIEIAGNDQWMICRPEMPPPPPLPDPPDNAINPEDWLAQERFMIEVVQPNLQRNRTSSVSLRLTDDRGRTLPGADVGIVQETRDFGIGSALNHFSAPAAHSREFRAPLVHEKELARFLEVFNYTVVPFSGKWDVIEPVKGERNLEPLDRYVAWCKENDITLEFHFVTGYVPKWVEDLDGPGRQAALLRHAEDLIERYADDIDIWQILNERHMQNEAPEVFALFREKHPRAQLGVSHCSRFFSDRDGDRRERDLLRGWDSVRQVQNSGATVDYFGVHAHRPFGTWWDPRVIYEVLDEYQARGLRVRVTETGISNAGAIAGSVLEGEWNEDLQAEYLRRFLTVLYSHPNVDGVNFWGFGPRNWQRHINLLDRNYEPLPAFHELSKLVNETWKTQETQQSTRQGLVTFRGYHGRYRLQARLPDGRTAEATFHLGPDTPTRQDIQLDLTTQPEARSARLN
ncbi:MAG: endo-1,4-beta-xylanase [Verrucomicrobia bacterium]|nr:endo-1,4-beta-xylanase [Verrucomicrobiota bacterium]MCH8512378.1 endo-1,4-beta-xylanase [Kiritimatiellia bacterium]